MQAQDQSILLCGILGSGDVSHKLRESSRNTRLVFDIRSYQGLLSFNKGSIAINNNLTNYINIIIRRR